MTSYIEDIIKAFEELAGVKLHDHIRFALHAAIEGNATIQRLHEDSLTLRAYEAAGVDNWQGIDEAYALLEEWKSEDAPSDEGTEED